MSVRNPRARKEECLVGGSIAAQKLPVSSETSRVSLYIYVERFHEECGILSLKINRTKIDCIRLPSHRSNGSSFITFCTYQSNATREIA